MGFWGSELGEGRSVGDALSAVPSAEPTNLGDGCYRASHNPPRPSRFEPGALKVFSVFVAEGWVCEFVPRGVCGLLVRCFLDPWHAERAGAKPDKGGRWFEAVVAKMHFAPNSRTHLSAHARCDCLFLGCLRRAEKSEC